MPYCMRVASMFAQGRWSVAVGGRAAQKFCQLGHWGKGMSRGTAARGGVMSFKADNRAYEKWLRTQCEVVERDLQYKHERMKESPFVFLRATFFRWAGQIE